jgi:hypothetical protein
MGYLSRVIDYLYLGNVCHGKLLQSSLTGAIAARAATANSVRANLIDVVETEQFGRPQATTKPAADEYFRTLGDMHRVCIYRQHTPIHPHVYFQAPTSDPENSA